MFHYGLAVSLLALILGDGVSTVSAQDGSPKYLCFLGYPTFTCRWNCMLSGGTTSCNEDLTCHCQVVDDEVSEETQPQTGGQDERSALEQTSPSLVVDPTPSERPYSEQCFSGYPSLSCRFRCFMKYQQGSCVSDDLCECRDDDEVEDSQETLSRTVEDDDYTSPSSEDSSEDYETEESTTTIFLFSFKLFGSNNETDNNDTSATAGPEMQPEDSSLMSADTRLLLENTVALIIILLLTVLIVMELYACYNKNKGKGHIQTLFKTPN